MIGDREIGKTWAQTLEEPCNGAPGAARARCPGGQQAGGLRYDGRAGQKTAEEKTSQAPNNTL